MRIVRRIMLWFRSKTQTSPDDDWRKARAQNEAIERIEQEKLRTYFMHGGF